MFLTIPVSNLLYSQLDIGIDPLRGNLTYNIKDIPSRLQYGYSAGNLVLTLQSLPGEGDSSMSLRIRTNSAAGSACQSANTSQALAFAAVPSEFAGQSDQHHAPSAGVPTQPIPDIHSRGFFSLPGGYENPDGTNGPYTLRSENHEPSIPLMNEQSPWEAPHGRDVLSPQDTSLMSPISKTLSLITSGTIFEVTDSIIHESYDFSGYNDFHYSEANCLDGNPRNATTHGYISESMTNMIDGQAFEQNGRASTSCASLSTTVFPGYDTSVQDSPLSQHSVLSLPSQWAAIGAPTEQARSIETQAVVSDNQEASTNDVFTPASSSISDSSTHESRPQSREGEHGGYPCPYAACKRVLKSLYTRQLHMKTHITKPRKNFACTMGCSESFTRHHDRLRHEVSQHGKQCEFSCKRCDRFFSSQRMMDRHTCWGSRVGLLRWQIKDGNDSHSET